MKTGLNAAQRLYYPIVGECPKVDQGYRKQRGNSTLFRCSWVSMWLSAEVAQCCFTAEHAEGPEKRYGAHGHVPLHSAISALSAVSDLFLSRKKHPRVSEWLRKSALCQSTRSLAKLLIAPHVLVKQRPIPRPRPCTAWGTPVGNSDRR